LSPVVGLLDYGTGNVASLERAFAAIGAQALLVSAPSNLAAIDAVVLPGVGHFGPASAALISNGLHEALLSLVRSGLPTLGICLGFQLLTSSSEEAPGASGLGLLPDLCSVRIRPAQPSLHKVPHLGWNSLDQTQDSPSLLDGIAAEDRLFYFANAYAVAPAPSLVHPHALYSHDSPWLGLVQHGKLCGVQFHPEKSRGQGLQLLRNFLGLV
jgi:glutamine amidotransferase